MLTSVIREERTRPGSSISGVVLAATENYVAIRASPRTFAVVERSKLSNPVLPGERVKAIVESERITIAIVNRGAAAPCKPTLKKSRSDAKVLTLSEDRRSPGQQGRTERQGCLRCAQRRPRRRP